MPRSFYACAHVHFTRINKVETLVDCLPRLGTFLLRKLHNNCTTMTCRFIYHDVFMDNVNTRRQVFCSLFKLIALVPCKRIKSSASSLLCVVGFYQCLCCVLTFSCSIAVCRWWFCFQEKEASWLSFSGSHWYWGYGVLFNYRAVLLLRLHFQY